VVVVVVVVVVVHGAVVVTVKSTHREGPFAVDSGHFQRGDQELVAAHHFHVGAVALRAAHRPPGGDLGLLPQLRQRTSAVTSSSSSSAWGMFSCSRTMVQQNDSESGTT